MSVGRIQKYFCVVAALVAVGCGPQIGPPDSEDEFGPGSTFVDEEGNTVRVPDDAVVTTQTVTTRDFCTLNVIDPWKSEGRVYAQASIRCDYTRDWIQVDVVLSQNNYWANSGKSACSNTTACVARTSASNFEGNQRWCGKAEARYQYSSYSHAINDGPDCEWNDW
jgi:hypothetical protein